MTFGAHWGMGRPLSINQAAIDSQDDGYDEGVLCPVPHDDETVTHPMTCICKGTDWVSRRDARKFFENSRDY